MNTPRFDHSWSWLNSNLRKTQEIGVQKQPYSLPAGAQWTGFVFGLVLTFLGFYISYKSLEVAQVSLEKAEAAGKDQTVVTGKQQVALDRTVKALRAIIALNKRQGEAMDSTVLMLRKQRDYLAASLALVQAEREARIEGQNKRPRFEATIYYQPNFETLSKKVSNVIYGGRANRDTINLYRRIEQSPYYGFGPVLRIPSWLVDRKGPIQGREGKPYDIDSLDQGWIKGQQNTLRNSIKYSFTLTVVIKNVGNSNATNVHGYAR